MRGGAVVAAAGNYRIDTDPYSGGLLLQPITDGIGDLLSAYGLTVGPELVMDPQNEAFPVPVTRQIGHHYRARDPCPCPIPTLSTSARPVWPPIAPWCRGSRPSPCSGPSPITVDATANVSREVTSLIQSSADSWTSTDAVAQPGL